MTTRRRADEIFLCVFLCAALSVWTAAEAAEPNAAGGKKSGGKQAQASASGADADFIIREQMVIMSRQLGVTCTHCHDTNNLKSTAMRTHAIAREHLRVTRLLNSKDGFNGKLKVDCYTCHRGKAVPDYLEPVPQTARQASGSPTAPATVPAKRADDAASDDKDASDDQ